MKTEKYFQTTEDFGLNLEYCGIEYCRPNFIMPTHRRDVFLIHYVFKGEGIFEFCGAEYAISSGDLFTIFPNTFTSYRANPDNPFCFCWFGFSGKNAERLLNRSGFSPEEPVCALTGANALLDLVEECIKRTGIESSSAEIEIQSILYRMFSTIEFCRFHKNERKGNGNAAWEHVQNAKSYIRFNYMNGISVGDISQNVGLERTYFSKLFHQAEGVTPQQYLLGYRMNVARRLLLETSYSIKEIGYMVGISDAYYFSHAFKKLTDLSPSQYRNQGRAHAEE